MGFFIRPKSSTDNNPNGLNNVEQIQVAQGVDEEYIPTSNFNSTQNTSGALHRKDPKRREAEPNSPLPTGNAPKGFSGTARSWRGAATKNVGSGFGKGTRAGQTGVRRG